MEQLDKLPPLAIVVFGVTLAIIFGVRYMGLLSGRNAAPEHSPAAAQVAAVIVDPTALNKATAAMEAQTFEMINTRKSQERIAEALAERMKDLGEEIGGLILELARHNK